VIDLRKTLITAHGILKAANIKHALIGGFALAHYGIYRTTQDIDLLVDGKDPEKIKTLFEKEGFKVIHQSEEVLQLSGIGFVDLLLAKRPMSLAMLDVAEHSKDLNVYVLKAEDIIGLKIQAINNDSTRENKDLADIQDLITSQPQLDWNLIKKYADMFQAWNKISPLKK